MENSKKIFLFRHFKIDLLLYETCKPDNDFIETLLSSFVSPLILLPTRTSNSFSTLIDNIFCNVTSTPPLYQATLYQQPRITFLKWQ